MDEGDNDGSTETTDGDGSSVNISGSFPVYPGLGVGGVGGSPSGAAGLLAALDELDSAEIPGSPSGIDWSELPSLSIDYQPDTSGLKGNGLPEAEVSQIHNVQGTGTDDGISRGAPPAAALTLIALATAGRDPADITIPTIGSKAASGGEGSSGSGSSSSSRGTGSSGSGSGRSSGTSRTRDGGSGSADALVARPGGASPSGVMVSQGVVTVASGSGTVATGSTSSSSTNPETTTVISTSDAEVASPDADGGGGGAKGSSESSWWAETKAFFGSIGTSVTYAAQKVDQAVGVVATAALTGQVVDMESASGVQIAGAFGGGLQTGGKAVVNGTASAAVNTLTLGMVDKNIEVITVTAEDRAIGYDAAAGSAKFGATVLISTLGPGAVTNVAKGFGGAQAACTTGKVLAVSTPPVPLSTSDRALPTYGRTG